TTTSSKATPTRRGSRPRSRPRRRRGARSSSWSATNITASTDEAVDPTRSFRGARSLRTRNNDQFNRPNSMMRIAEALEAFRPHPGNALVVPGRGGRYWVDQTSEPNLDVPLGDPAMGGHAGFALGLALARPERKCVLFDSEGDILMSLGMLAT